MAGPGLAGGRGSIAPAAAQCLIWALAAVQFIFTLFMSRPNDNLLRFTKGLTAYSYHIMQYLTYNVEDKPFPFSAWPK